LILGDSISIGYTPFVIAQMEGQARVQRPLHKNGSAENCQGTRNGVKHIDRWLGDIEWDIIHFNFGLHDLKRVDAITGKNSKKKEDPFQSDLKTYRKNLKQIVEQLKLTSAKLVFATTTPYPGYPDGPLREPGLSEKYNRVALKIMKSNEIAVNDLYTFVKPRMKDLMIPNNVHFTKTGSEIVAREVVRQIKLNLKLDRP
jgi:acyl-CoA thioesterase-1